MAKINYAPFAKGIRNLARKYEPENVMRIAEGLAWQMIKFAVASPIPRDIGTLEDKRFVERIGKSRIRFGFNEKYAAFQDQPRKQSGYVIVKPVRAKILYIPISQAGRRDHYRGNNPDDEGLTYGEDYVLAHEARIPIKAYGSDEGPNHYLSGTIRRKSKWFLQQLAARLKSDMAAANREAVAAGSGSGSSSGSTTGAAAGG